MNSAEYVRILNEIDAHPKERNGFNRNDFSVIHGAEKEAIIDRFLLLIGEGAGYSEQLEWLLGAEYVNVLSARLRNLPAKSHGLVYLPYFLFNKTKDIEYIKKMMREVVGADPSWEGREKAISYLYRAAGSHAVFCDFCLYILLNVPDFLMKESAMIWLAKAKGYLSDDLQLPADLIECLNKLAVSNGSDESAMLMLGKMHTDTGQFLPADYEIQQHRQ